MKEARSRIATSLNIPTSISSGRAARGHGGAGVPSITGGAGSIERPENPAMSSLIVCGCPWREWWAVLGAVADALEGFVLVGFEAK
jgi:hypothetical protein